ncbi:BREX-3 system phosphatase PglZ [Carnobacterium divergens]|uniref:BREX-3 system phosphatase PglZ n=1 Tax=Carnobacterium divergens TaxID=2748 RepID=UPI00288CB568|nr:BREX-3 system phosphatase PglZ [Carnobacterium divergens]MDT1997487.1 BREX-3 system phosphatase PglZ [Carnobacterium divergens]
MNWSEKIASYFTGNGLIYIVADEHNILGQSKIKKLLNVQGRVLHFYEDPLLFRELYESNFRHLNRTERQTLLIIIKDSQFNQIPYDVYEQAVHLTLSFDTFFPNLDSSVLKECSHVLYDVIFSLHSELIQPLNGRETADFLLNKVCSINTSSISNEAALIKSGLLYYEKYNEGLPKVLLKRLNQILYQINNNRLLESRLIFQSKECFKLYLNQMWQQHIDSFEKGAEISKKKPIHSWDYFNDPFIQRYIFQYIEPVKVSNANRYEQWMFPGLFIQEETASLIESLFRDDYSLFEINDWLRFASKLGQLQNQLLLREQHEEYFQDNVSKANESFDKWIKENFHKLRSLSVLPKPKMVHQIPHYLSRKADKKIALIVLDGMSFTQWHLIKNHLHSKDLKTDETAVFSWIPSITSVSRQALFSGNEPSLFSNTISTTHKEKILWTSFWEQQGFSKQNIAYEKSLGLKSYNQEELAYYYSPSVRIYGAVIDIVDKFMHGASQGLQTIQSEMKTWLNSGYLDYFLEDLIDSGFEVYLTADHGNIECIGTGRITQGITVDSKGERARIYSSLNIRNFTAYEHDEAFIWDDTSLPNNYHVLLAKKNGAFVPKNQKIVAHGGIHIEEMIVPFAKVYR